MANQIAVSFEDEHVRVVYASSRGGSLTVRKTLLLKNEELDNFLSREKAHEFIVVADFKAFHQDILYLPPAPEKYLGRIVYSEIRKTIPRLRDFSFFYTVLGESVRDGKRVIEVFFYAVENHELFQIIRRFDDCNKTVKYFLPVAAALSRLADASSDKKGPRLCIAKTGAGKTLFLTKDGKIYFTRTSLSPEASISAADVHDINMTVDYCSETLRITPASILLLNLEHGDDMGFAVPAADMFLPRNIRAPQEDAMDYMAPIAALLPERGLNRISVLPREYALLAVQKRMFAFCTILFILLSLAGLGYLRMKAPEISRLKQEVEMLRNGIGLMEPGRRTYELRNNELRKYLPLINFVNTVSSAPDVQKALIFLSELKTTHADGLQLNAVTVTAATGALQLQFKLNGGITAEKYADMQKRYSDLVNELRAARGMIKVSDSLDLKTRNFQIEALYNDK